MRFGGREGGFSFEDPEKKKQDEKKEKMRRSWESYEKEADPIQRLEIMENILAELMESSRNELALEIISKFLQKIKLKKDIISMQDHWDDATYQKMKGLGIFIALHRKIEHDFSGLDERIDLKKGDEIIDLHLPPVSGENKKNLMIKVKESFIKISEYINKNGLQPKYITGITYGSIGKLAPRYGFQALEIPLPEELKEPVKRVYQETERGKAGKPIDGIYFAFQKTEDFLERFNMKK